MKKDKVIAQIYSTSDIYNLKVKILSDKVNNFDFLRIKHKKYGYVLAQIMNIQRNTQNEMIGFCKIIGYRKDSKLLSIRQPFETNAEIELANDEFIEHTLGFNRVEGAMIGHLSFKDKLKINLPLKDLLTKHISILAKSGSGKSYTVGVLLEEIIKHNIPIVVLDLHNEYHSLRFKNQDKQQLESLKKFNLSAKGFNNEVKIWSPRPEQDYENQLLLSIENLNSDRLFDSLINPLSHSSKSLIHNVLSGMNNQINIDELIFHLSNEETNTKWTIISALEELKKTRIFSNKGTPLNEIVKHRQASIINLKGIPHSITETFVMNLLTDLFQARKKEEIPPFLLVVEESHNFCSELNLGKKKTNDIITTIASEGRKFGLGLCVISQRASKVNKNVLSQCNTQIIMNIVNERDIKAVINSSEGLDTDTGNEIQRLEVGSCILAGLMSTPLKIKVRPRQSRHGGDVQ